MRTLLSCRGALRCEPCTAVHVMALCSVDSNGPPTVRLRLSTGARPSADAPTAHAAARPPDWVAYCDGGCGANMAGWGWVLVRGGDGDQDEHAVEMLSACGPVLTERGHPAFLGATKMSNNTGELSAAAELLLGLLDEPNAPPPESRGVIRPDSELAMGVMTGRVAVQENVALAKRVRALWLKVRARYERRVTLKWVKGHSDHKWNDRADELAELGRQGDIHAVRTEWHEARDAHASLSPVSSMGRFAFPARRTILIRRDALDAKICVRTAGVRRDVEWVDAGCAPPRFHVRHDWTARAEALMTEARDATVGWTKVLGTSTVAILLHPSVTDAAAARQGLRRFEAKLAGETVMHAVPHNDGQTDSALARLAWKVERFCEQEAVELRAAWLVPAGEPAINPGRFC